MGECVSLESFYSFLEALRGVVEAMQNHFLQSEPAQLSHRAELWRVERHVRDQGQRGISLEQAGYCSDVHDPVGGGVEYDDAHRLPPNEGLELLPGGSNQKLRLVSKDVLDVGEEP